MHWYRIITVATALALLSRLPAQKKAPFAIVNLALLEAEDGFPAREDRTYLPGEILYLAFNIQGYSTDRQNHVRLSYRIDALDPKGIPFFEPEAGKIDTELAPQDAKWMPRVRFSPAIPPFADSGTYKFVVHVADELAKTELTQELTFRVRGRDVTPSEQLVLRNFTFSRKEDGDPIPTPAYRRGDTLWASFDITGYRSGPGNKISVQYDLAVYNAEGKKLFEQPEPALEEGISFYPRRYVHAVFSLNLEPSLQPGEYTIVLSLRDNIGSQTAESRHSFTVE